MANQLTALRCVKAVLFTVVGVAAMLGCVLAALYTWEFTATAAAAPGAVTRLNAGDSHVQVQFTTAAGEIIEYAQNGMIDGYQIGDRVEVLYDPGDPKANHVVNTFGSVWGFTLFGFLAGAMFVGLAQLALRRPDLIG